MSQGGSNHCLPGQKGWDTCTVVAKAQLVALPMFIGLCMLQIWRCSGDLSAVQTERRYDRRQIRACSDAGLCRVS